MKKIKKLHLTNLTIDSFVTSLEPKRTNTIKAGSSVPCVSAATAVASATIRSLALYQNASNLGKDCEGTIINTDPAVFAGSAEGGGRCAFGGSGNGGNGEIHSAFDGFCGGNSDYEINGQCQ